MNELAILQIMAEEGFGFDCSSIPELVLARRAGATPDQIMFTSNNTSREEFFVALSNGGCILNLDDITMIDKVPGEFPELICFRYNPGPKRTGNTIIGNPAEAKYGVADFQIIEAYRKAIKKGAKRFGLHTMLCSNERNYTYMVATVTELLELLEKINFELGIKFEFINVGGGIGIPYKPTDNEFNLEALGIETAALLDAFEKKHGWVPKLCMESGRYMTGPHGALVTRVINQKHIYREYRGVDACMSSLMRPGMYGVYHHGYVLDQDGRPKLTANQVVSVVGALCENNDMFAVDRPLPEMVERDFYVIADTGAHGIAMCFNYNGRTRPKGLLLKIGGGVQVIERAEQVEDLFSRFVYDGMIYMPKR